MHEPPHCVGKLYYALKLKQRLYVHYINLCMFLTILFRGYRSALLTAIQASITHWRVSIILEKHCQSFGKRFRRQKVFHTLDELQLRLLLELRYNMVASKRQIMSSGDLLNPNCISFGIFASLFY